VVALVAALWLTRSHNPLNPDTPSYLYFDPSRSIGYPAFLWLTRTVTGSAAFAVPLQMTLLAAALFLLGWSFHALSQPPIWSIIAQTLLVANPTLWNISAELMSEALATACVALWCAQLLRVLRRPSANGLMFLGIAAATGMLIRPPLIALVAGSAVAVLLLPSSRDRTRAFVALTMSCGIGWALTPAAFYMIHGSTHTTSPFARGVLQHTLYCPQPPTDRDRDSAFVELNAARVQGYIRSAPSDLQPALKHAFSAPLRFRLFIPTLGRRHGLQAAWQTDPILSKIAAERVAGNPRCYAMSVGTAYFELLTHQTLHSAAQARRFGDFIGAHPPVVVPSEQLLPADDRALSMAAAQLHQPRRAFRPERAFEWSGKNSAVAVFVARVVYGTAAVVALLSFLVLRRTRRTASATSQTVIVMACLGISLHCLFAITAIVEFALMRYMVPAWPIVCVLLVLTARAIVTASSGRYRALAELRFRRETEAC
jgi:4-amino-4-deoxy-L-arabinose transferase-like glycosyltransferase